MWTLKTSRGQRLALPRLPVVVGNDKGVVDVVIPHPSLAPSHARFAEGEDGGLAVKALGDALVEVGGWKVSEAQLEDGDELVLGKVPFTVVRDGEAPARPARAAAPASSERPARPAAGAGAGASRAARPAQAAPKADELVQRGKAPLRSARPEAKAGLLHIDLSQLSGGARLLVVLLMLAVGAGLVYGVAFLMGAL